MALFACLIIRFFQPEQCFPLTTNQPEQCFGLFFQRSEWGHCVTFLLHWFVLFLVFIFFSLHTTDPFSYILCYLFSYGENLFSVEECMVCDERYTLNGNNASSCLLVASRACSIQFCRPVQLICLLVRSIWTRCWTHLYMYCVAVQPLAMH